MFTSLEAFLNTWQYESDSTAKILRALTDAALAQRIGPEDRTLGRIAWHVVGSLGEMMNRTGLHLEGPAENEPVPAAAGAIAATYEKLAAALSEETRAHWTDATLGVVDDMYGEQWARGLTVDILIRHQAHHRGQMTVLMRQAGLSVPGVYGPSREEWSKYGQPPPAI
jgi:uncharacterized damage-inducible protein DinB